MVFFPFLREVFLCSFTGVLFGKLEEEDDLCKKQR